MRDRSLSRFLLVMMGCAWLAACNSEADSPPSNGGAAGEGGTSGGPGGADSLAGFVKVTLLEPVLPTDTPATSVAAYFYDRLPPPPLPLELLSEEGDCRLMVPSKPFCDPECEDSVCTEDGVCTPNANARSVGNVRVSGLGDGELTIEPVGPKFVYQGATLPNPPCDEGADVTVTADAFELRAMCVAPLELTSAVPVVVESGQPVALTWTPKGAGDARIEVVLDVAHHGGQTGEILCDVPDTGAMEIPEPLVTQLIELGVAGYPTITINRASRATAPNEPDLSLTVSSLVERAVDTGVPSCGDPSLCPPGGTCNETCPAGTTCGDDLICR
jgi:hypothetical protein